MNRIAESCAREFQPMHAKGNLGRRSDDHVGGWSYDPNSRNRSRKSIVCSDLVGTVHQASRDVAAIGRINLFGPIFFLVELVEFE
jgi:hypothetical protein